MKPEDIPAGVVPEVTAADPKRHPFVPYEPGSTKCRWCSFAITAHDEVAPDAELHHKDEEKLRGA